jgi:hypothetical protein
MVQFIQKIPSKLREKKTKRTHTHTHTSNTFGEKKCENVLDWSIIIAIPNVTAVEKYSLPQF